MVKVLLLLFLSSGVLLLYQCRPNEKEEQMKKKYVVSSPALRDTILYWDSVYYHAFAHCDSQQLQQLIFDDIEEFHDWGGVMVSRDFFLQSLSYRCGKLRETDGSVSEVYPIKNFGAIHKGLQRFYRDSSGIPTRISSWENFIHVWRHQDDQWKLTRIITLHPQPAHGRIYN